MKKSLNILTIVLAVAAMVAAFSCPALANVAGQCSSCHTMHDSQGGSAMATDGPHAALLLNDCVGCHTTPTSAPTDPFANATPYVRSTTSTGLHDDACLAGGFFPSGDMGTGNNADNHHGMGNNNAPAGMDTSIFYTGVANGFGCAGSNGCHGNEYDLSDMKAIKGGHHDTSTTYRMLYIDYSDAATKTPVCGLPAVDYEEAIIATPSTGVVTSGSTQNVNIYSAGSTTTNATISEFCAKCHGIFHGANGTPANGTTNSDGEWIRHPSDAVLPTGWEMGGTYTLDGTDAKNNPFGYVDAVLSTSTRQATCLSCHRAHGTENADLLRWAYSTQSAGGGNDYGCLGCHNLQR